MISFTIAFSEYSLTLPLNPDTFNIVYAGNNATVDIVGLGEVVIPRLPKLPTFEVKSYFPSCLDKRTRRNYIKYFLDLWQERKQARFSAPGLTPEVDMDVVMESFQWDIRAGEEEDVYFTATFKEYKPFGATVVNIPEEFALPDPPPRVEEKPKVEQTYTVVRGDCLWNIAKRFTGNGNNWGALYDLNKGIIGGKPNLIYPGQVYVLPESWVNG